jgi:uncharacterized protein (TIGR03083 family)
MRPGLDIRDEAMRAFISSMSQLQATAPTWCAGWSAHDLAAHVAAAAEERANLIEEYLAGDPPRATRSWEVREPPYRAMPDAALRERLVEQAARFESNLSALREDDMIPYTGWVMSAQQFRMHSHSEAVLHRWDLVGDDDIGIRWLSDPSMVTHALAVFAAVPALAEAQRWRSRDSVSSPLVLRCDGRPDVAVTPGKALSGATDGEAVVLDLRPHEVPLVLWGRCPSRLRDPKANGETIDSVLHRLLGRLPPQSSR